MGETMMSKKLELERKISREEQCRGRTIEGERERGEGKAG
jgi:hypothetical protein